MLRWRGLLRKVARTLELLDKVAAGGAAVVVNDGKADVLHVKRDAVGRNAQQRHRPQQREGQAQAVARQPSKIGRASCRERV